MAQQLPQGWYVDPADSHRYRWWAGDHWTADTLDRAEIDIAAVEAEMARPLPDFDDEGAAPAAPAAPEGRPKVPVLLALAALVAIVASAGVVAFRPGHDGHLLSGEIRVPASEAAGWTARAERNLDDGAPCGEGAGGIGAGTTVTVRNAKGETLGEARLGAGRLDRQRSRNTCVFAYAVDGVGDARLYVVKVGRHGAGRASREQIEAAGWNLDVRL